MKAEQFYQTHSDKARPLIGMNSKDYPKQAALLSNFEQNVLASQQFKGMPGDVGVIYDAQGHIEKVYIGQDDMLDAKAIAHAMSQLPPADYELPRPVSISVLAAWAIAQYQFDQYKPSKTLPKILTVTDVEYQEVLAQVSAVFLIRDLINTPANEMGPKALADCLESMAKRYQGTFKQSVGNDLLLDHYPAIHAVGRAAEAEPRLLSMTWGDMAHPRVTLVGKGVCFDTGGLDIKPANYMRLMKKDMGGAAQVMGLAQWVMESKLPVYLTVLIPAVENAVSSNAYRPGDVITMRNGLKVEIDNTDAEGRLVLADALAKACEDAPDLLIDFATLTGAARVAVGTELSALFASQDTTAQQIEQAGLEVSDFVWRMPLFQGYANMLDSSVADLVNSAPSSYAGAITAALFLQRFVDKAVDWVHFDVMAWNISSKPGKPEGGEAMGVLATAAYLSKRYAN